MIENVSTQLTVFHCFAHCLLPGRAFASLYVLLFLEKEAEIGGRELEKKKNSFSLNPTTPAFRRLLCQLRYKTAKNMCRIDCRDLKCISNPTKFFYVQGNQEKRHRCATLADIFPDLETGVNDIECLLFV